MKISGFGDINKWSPADIYYANKKVNTDIVKHLTEVIQQNNINDTNRPNSKNTNNSGSNTNSLNVSNMATKKKNVYTNNSVKSKLGSFTLKKALNSINKML